ncbi:MAG: DUF6427 family protein [Capnocytophaga sp.]|nr:DUF6427 family protein [Capnocytophaga sp.]
MLNKSLNNIKSNTLLFLCLVGVFQVFTYRFFIFNSFSSWEEILSSFGIAILLIINIIIINSIDRQSHLSLGNSYLPFFILILTSFFPIVYYDIKIMISSVLTIIIFKKLLYADYNQDARLSFLDASMLVVIAFLFYNYSFLNIFLIWFSILSYGNKVYRNLFIPIIGVLIVFLLILVISIPFNLTNYFYNLINISFYLSIKDFLNKDFLPVILVVLINLSITSWCLWKRYKRKVSQFLIFITILGFLAVLFSQQKDASAMVFLTLPTSVSLVVILENIKRNWLKESVLWFFIIVSFSIFYYQHNS